MNLAIEITQGSRLPVLGSAVLASPVMRVAVAIPSARVVPAAVALSTVNTYYDHIYERTGGHGVEVDGVLLKDGEIGLTPKAASLSGAEGTMFYCSGDDHVYVAVE